MADRYWLGVSTDLTSTSNWSSTRNGTGGSSVPGSSDTAYFYDSATNVEANLSNFLAATVVIGGNYQGNIGTTGSALELGTTNAVCVIERMPRDYVNIAVKSGVTIATVHVKDASRGYVTITGTGTLTNLYGGANARINVDASVVVTNIKGAGSVFDVKYNSTAVTDVQLAGQSFTASRFERAITTGYFSDCAVEMRLSATLGTGTVDAGAMYTHNSNGTITTMNVKPRGMARAGDVRFTVTNSTVWQGGKLFEIGGDKVTYTNSPTSIGSFSTSGGIDR